VAAAYGAQTAVSSFVEDSVSSFTEHPVRSSLFAAPLLARHATVGALRGLSTASRVAWTASSEAARSAGTAFGLVEPALTWTAREQQSISLDRQDRARWAMCALETRFPGVDVEGALNDVRDHLDVQLEGPELDAARAACAAASNDLELRRVIATAWHAIEHYEDDTVPPAQIAFNQGCLKLAFQAALGSLIDPHGGWRPNPDVAPRLLTVLQGYYPEVGIDTQLEPGQLLSALGRELREQLQGQEPDDRQLAEQRNYCLNAAAREYADDPARKAAFATELEQYLRNTY
jgi:hypothetical protein